jgi:hypothetical protein
MFIMKPLLILSVFLLFFSPNGEASNFNFQPDSSISPKQLKEKNLLKKYGDDDTARALILYWFGKRHLHTAFVIGTVVILGSAAIELLPITGNSAGAFLVGFGLAVSAFFAGLAALFFVMNLFHFSRRKLVRILENYKAGKSLPKKYKRKIHIPVKKQA